MCKFEQSDNDYNMYIVQKVEIKKNMEKLLTEKRKDCIIIHVKNWKIHTDLLVGFEGGF